MDKQKLSKKLVHAKGQYPSEKTPLLGICIKTSQEPRGISSPG